MNVVVEAQDLVRDYNGFRAVNGVSFSVAQGEIFGLLGPNGAGKTTTILMLLGMTEPTSGVVRICGYDPTKEPLKVKRITGLFAGKRWFLRGFDGQRKPTLSS